MLRLIKTIKYMVGIAERGTGKGIPDDVTPETFVLDYVKSLEALKAGQGEPVGEVVASVVSESALAAIRWIDDNYTPKVGDKLYTSAPTIPDSSINHCLTCDNRGRVNGA